MEFEPEIVMIKEETVGDSVNYDKKCRRRRLGCDDNLKYCKEAVRRGSDIQDLVNSMQRSEFWIG